MVDAQSPGSRLVDLTVEGISPAAVLPVVALADRIGLRQLGAVGALVDAQSPGSRLVDPTGRGNLARRRAPDGRVKQIQLAYTNSVQ